MPYKVRPNCPGRGPRYGSCPNKRPKGETCCPECMPFEKQAVRRYDKKRDESPGRKFLHSTLWRRIRAAKLARDPLCERCLKGVEVTISGSINFNGTQIVSMVEPAVLVHHIDGNQQNNNENNLRSLCTPCHEAIHKDGRWGR